jgi:uncharacterized membrane protein
MKTKRAKQLLGIVGLAVVLGVLAGCARGSFTLPATLTAVSIPQGRSATQTITVTRTGNFAGEISFSVTGAPTGVTARFDPVRTTTTGNTSTLTLTVGDAVAVQRYTLRVVATSGRIRREATLELNVTVRPDFTMATAPATLTVRQGATGTVTVTLTRNATMTAAVALTLEGAPAGVTGAFAPASVPVTPPTSTLTLTVGAAAAPGAYTLTIRGRGDGIDKTATVRLTVEAAPDFSMALLPTAITVRPGESANVTITLTRVGGFADPVQFELEGAPTGVTATFDPNPAPAGTATLRIATGAAAAAGTYVLRVRGTAGAISKVVNVNLTIAP